MKHSTTAHALVAEGTHAVAYQSKEDYRKAARANREAIGLRPEKPDEPAAYFNLGNALNASGHKVEAAQRFLEAKERYPVGSKGWARATLGNGLQHAEARGVRRGGQAGVVERRGAQGAVGEDCEGGAEPFGSNQHAGRCDTRVG